MLQVDAQGMLTGDAEALRTNTLYTLSNGNHLAIFSDKGMVPEFAILRPTPKGAQKFTCIAHEMPKTYQEFSVGLREHIRKSGGSLVPAGDSVLAAFIRDGMENHPNMEQAAEFHAKRGTAGKITMAAHEEPYMHLNRLQKLAGGEKEALPEHAVAALQLPVSHPAYQRAGDAAHGVFEPAHSAPVEHSKALEPHSPAGAAPKKTVAETKAAASGEGAFSHFLREEKWVGKKGLAVAGGVVAIGAAVYAANRLSHSCEEPSTGR